MALPAKTIAIRADAGTIIGAGHVMRCLTLANVLRQCDHTVRFVCRAHAGHMQAVIQQQGFDCVMLPAPSIAVDSNHASWLGADWQTDAEETRAALTQYGAPDWLIIDHYGIDAEWETQVLATPSQLMVIDDLADRPHACDVLLDQTHGRATTDYAGLVPANTTVLTGSVYTLLRPDFLTQRVVAIQRGQHPNAAPPRLLLSLGAMDPTNVTSEMLSALAAHPWATDFSVTVVLSSKAPHLKAVQLQAAASPLNIAIKTDVADMAALLASMDIAIGAGGTSAWERACLGLPTVTLAIANNQQTLTHNLASAGLALAATSPADAVIQLKQLHDDPALRQSLITAGMLAVNGLGAWQITQHMGLAGQTSKAGIITLRPATPADKDTVYQWQTQPGQRQFARTPHPPTVDEHARWWANTMKNPNAYTLIAACTGQPVGMLRLDPPTLALPTDTMLPPDAMEVSILLDKNQQGQGMARAALTHLGEMFIGVPLVADIHPENTASVALFARCGYQPLSQRDDNRTYVRPAVCKPLVTA